MKVEEPDEEKAIQMMRTRTGTTGGFALLDTQKRVSVDACTHCSILHLDTTGTGMAFRTIPFEFKAPDA